MAMHSMNWRLMATPAIQGTELKGAGGRQYGAPANFDPGFSLAIDHNV
jgi:hypothetical protein